jgi:hypothetical protein
VYITITKPCIRRKKVRKYESQMTCLGGFYVMAVKGLFHSDWLGAGPAVSPIGSQLGKGEIGRLGTPMHYRDELRAALADFLDSA